MVLPLILRVISFLCLTSTAALAISMSKLGCQEKCGNITIPYPFGIGSDCSANSSFTIICKNSTIPFLSSINMEARKISLLGIVVVKQAVSPMNRSAKQNIGRMPISLKESPFTISARYNTLAVLGCKNSIWLVANETTIVGGCTAMCDANSLESSCNGVNCCQTTLPPRLKELKYTYKTQEGNTSATFCGYVSTVDKKWLKEHYKRYKGLLYDVLNLFDQETGFAPLLLEWEFGALKGYTDGICTYSNDECLSYPDDFGRRIVYDVWDGCRTIHLNNFCQLYPTGYSCDSANADGMYYSTFYEDHQFTNYYRDYDYASSIKYCTCPAGYVGNPYLPEGCIDIDECNSNGTYGSCSLSSTCINVKGTYSCQGDNMAKYRARRKIAFISTGSGIGALIVFLIAWWSKKAIRKRIKANRRCKFFKRNGGLLLEQQLSATEIGLDKTKLYSSKELTLATDHYNENRILGHGGQGTVYKGMLKDGMIVAVKKSKKVEEADLQVFIKEVVILSQVNHRNVVKLLGCCLETEVPLLVYKFISNGTLFQHVHEPNEEFPFTWEMRVRIAREVAGSLAYLHSSASTPIYHRDIKSTNILLDDKYRAKISDFGTSRSIAIDRIHLTTRVQGTFGYFDPEYFQSSQFTDKSDVYSFGVVMVELLTGEKALSSRIAQSGMNLAMHFLHSMEENQLFEILDARVLQEGKREEITVVAHLATRCLHHNDKRRPTMKEVSAVLEGLKELEECCNIVVQNSDYSREFRATEDAETQDFSSTSESMHSDSISPYPPEVEYPLSAQP